MENEDYTTYYCDKCHHKWRGVGSRKCEMCDSKVIYEFVGVGDWGCWYCGNAGVAEFGIIRYFKPYKFAISEQSQ